MRAIIYPQQAKPLKGALTPPSSKNYSTRFLLATALFAQGKSTLLHPAESEDFQAILNAAKQLGAKIARQHNALAVQGVGGQLTQPRTPIDVGNAGTVLRLLLGAVSSTLPKAEFTTSYWKSLGTRPNQDLLDALSQLGVKSESNQGKLPITIYGGKGRLHGGKVVVSGEVSSQYASSILFLAPLVGEAVQLEVTGKIKSKPAIRTTLDVMKKCGVRVQANEDLSKFAVPSPQKYRAGNYEIPGDFPSASYLLSAAAITKSDVTIKRLYKSEQGEAAIIPVLKKMGADISYNEKTGIARIRGGRQLKAIEFDGDLATDAVLAMAAAAVFAKGTSRFYNVENLRYKECDRIYDFCAELTKAGANVEPRPAEIIVRGTPEGVKGGCAIDSHHDHRVIMALSICALRAKAPITINDAHHVAKSYPNFFKHLKKLGAKIVIEK